MKMRQREARAVMLVVAMSALIARAAWAQSTETSTSYVHDEAALAEIFASTMWMPGRGVTLLRDDAAIHVWRRMKKTSCSIPDFGENGLRAFKVFRTAHLYIFTFHTWEGIDWSVCQRETGETEFQAANISAGYANGDPKQPFDNCSSGSVGTTVRFRSYVKDGPLLLEVQVPGCRGGESHHEFLFSLDQETLQEVPGSRFIINDYYGNSDGLRGWMWWPVDKKYSSFGEMRWTDEGALAWTRRFHKLPNVLSTSKDPGVEEYKKSVYVVSCAYLPESHEVSCDETLETSGQLSKEGFTWLCEEKYIEAARCASWVSEQIKVVKRLGYEVTE